MTSTAIAIEGISHVYEALDGTAVAALDAIDLTIRENEFVAIVGPSGCGKSTLLRIIAGLVRPTRGRVTVGGDPVTGPRADIGIVFQSPTLLPWADLITNVVFPLRIAGRLDASGYASARQLLALAGLSGFERKMPSELSGGMQQRVALCRALVQNPRILLMDEPFGALDALTREEMSLELIRICGENPKTIYFVTHSISEAVLLADRVVVMSPRPGRVTDIIDFILPSPRSFDLVSDAAFIGATQRIRHHIFGKRNDAGPVAA
jgi:NitT/TauT family transport system ATP-binding protein